MPAIWLPVAGWRPHRTLQDGWMMVEDEDEDDFDEDDLDEFVLVKYKG